MSRSRDRRAFEKASSGEEEKVGELVRTVAAVTTGVGNASLTEVQASGAGIGEQGEQEKQFRREEVKRIWSMKDWMVEILNISFRE